MSSWAAAKRALTFANIVWSTCIVSDAGLKLVMMASPKFALKTKLSGTGSPVESVTFSAAGALADSTVEASPTDPRFAIAILLVVPDTCVVAGTPITPSLLRSWWKLGSRDSKAGFVGDTEPIGLLTKLPLLSVFQTV